MAKKKMNATPEMELPVEQDALALQNETDMAAMMDAQESEDVSVDIQCDSAGQPNFSADTEAPYTEDTQEHFILESEHYFTDTPDSSLEPGTSEDVDDLLSDGVDTLLDIAPNIPAEILEDDYLSEPMPLKTSVEDFGDSEALVMAQSKSLSIDMESTAPKTSLVKKAEEAPVSFRSGSHNFYKTDFKRLDKGLSEQEKEEWNAIYASFRSGSILTGTVAGADQNELPVKNPVTGRMEMRTITSLVVIGYRVKVLIPESETWMRGEERGAFLLREMAGATVDYVILSVDREGGCAIASRSLALNKRRRAFLASRNSPKPGDIVKCSALVVGPMRCLVNYGGFDIPQHVSQMSYTPVLDMRELYRPGQEFNARLTGYDAAENRLQLCIKEAEPHPFEGADLRHPAGCRRQARIQGKYAGGVFCVLQDKTICFCLYSNAHDDSEFLLGDSVILYIAQYDYKNRFIYGRIVSKW